jgi:hypothetical protein
LDPYRVVQSLKGTMLYATGTVINNVEVDVVGAFNDKRDPDLMRNVGWKPDGPDSFNAALDVEKMVLTGAGPNRK